MDGGEKSFAVDNRIKHHHICSLISTKCSTGRLPSIRIRRLLWTGLCDLRGPIWKLAFRVRTFERRIGREWACDFIILCVCLEVFHSFRFLTNLCPNGMTLGINEALAVSSNSARSSKSCFRAPLLPTPLSLPPSASTSYDNAQTGGLRNTTSSTLSVYSQEHISCRARRTAVSLLLVEPVEADE